MEDGEGIFTHNIPLKKTGVTTPQQKHQLIRVLVAFFIFGLINIKNPSVHE